MALVNCRECGKQLSDQAATCPSCGAPQHPAFERAGVVTTQQTAKKYKVLQLVGVLVLLFGVIVRAGTGEYWGTAVAMLGLLLFVAGRLGAWWRHG
jgi:RNA polymerase subunit RPABC4/transcription elongation factor Spt4